eukprot:SAG11_NODE_387_length_9883_cov_9.365699_6_plen_110_part_00
MHPDKNPDDPDANSNFQRLGERAGRELVPLPFPPLANGANHRCGLPGRAGDVYQTLSNPELRKKYDKHGATKIEEEKAEGGVQHMDSEQVRSMSQTAAATPPPCGVEPS